METKYNAIYATEIFEPCDLLGCDAPVLPEQFTANQLAAHMLDGAGTSVTTYYGDWNSGPNTGSLNDLNILARLALTGAYAAYRLAQEKVGALDLSAQTRRNAAHKAYWKEPSNEALLKEFDEAQKSWDVAYQTWLNLMVRELLAPDNTQSKTEPLAETPPAPVVDAWSVKKPQRYGGYTAPLHALLTTAYRNGKPCPTARDVVEAFRVSNPPEVAKVLTDSFDYYDANGDTKIAGLDAIREAIKRMTGKR